VHTAVLATAAVSALAAHTFFGIGFGPLLSLAPVAGLIAALCCDDLLGGAAAGGLSVVAGTLLAQLAYARALPGPDSGWLAVLPGGWPANAIAAVVLAALVGAAAIWLKERSPRFPVLLAGLAVALVVLAGLMNGLAAASLVQDAQFVSGVRNTGLPLTQALVVHPTQTAESLDETLYLIVVQKMHAGAGFYPTIVQALADSNRVHTDGQVRLNLPVSYRMPTVYWLLSRLPEDGGSLVLAALLLGAAAAVAAYLLGRQFVSAAWALVGCAAISSYAATVGASAGLLYVEYWTGLLGVIAVAFFAAARGSTRRVLAMQIAAAAVATLAALTRELAIPFLIAGLIAVLADPVLRHVRAWIPWLTGLAATGVAYAVHWRLALAAFASSGVPNGVVPARSRFPWFHPDGSGLFASMKLIRMTLHFNVIAIYVVLALAVVGIVLLPNGRGTRIMLALIGVVGVGLLAIVRAVGTDQITGEPAGYWGLVVVPVALACLPLVVSRLVPRRDEREPATRTA